MDDDVVARTIYCTYLQAMGCRVVSAIDGMLGVEMAIQHLPDIIVMDLVMPRLDGWEAVRRLRERPDTMRIPIIALSAEATSRDSARAIGCDAFLAKPCLPELLWCEIRVVLHGDTP